MVIGLKQNFIYLCKAIDLLALPDVIYHLLGGIKYDGSRLGAFGAVGDYLFCSFSKGAQVIFFLDYLAVAFDVCKGGNALGYCAKIFLSRCGVLENSLLNGFVQNGDDVRVYSQSELSEDYGKKLTVL